MRIVLTWYLVHLQRQNIASNHFSFAHLLILSEAFHIWEENQLVHGLKVLELPQQHVFLICPSFHGSLIHELICRAHRTYTWCLHDFISEQSTHQHSRLVPGSWWIFQGLHWSHFEAALWILAFWRQLFFSFASFWKIKYLSAPPQQPSLRRASTVPDSRSFQATCSPWRTPQRSSWREV